MCAGERMPVPSCAEEYPNVSRTVVAVFRVFGLREMRWEKWTTTGMYEWSTVMVRVEGAASAGALLCMRLRLIISLL